LSKTAEAFRTISEVAEELDVPKHVLRFWEGRFPQIKPMKRGGGRRYYRPEDMALLRGICRLLHAEGYTIKGVQKILREQGVDTVKRVGQADGPPASETGSAAAAAEPPAKKGRRGAAARADANALSKAEMRERLLATIAELETCRKVLLGKPQSRTAARRAAPKQRRAARA
jgi:DNA-binding transcriptional MerR regulator